MKRITVLGSTGSIGRSTLDVVSAFPDRFGVFGLTAGNNTGLLLAQIKKFSPKFVAVPEKAACELLRKELRGLQTEILCGIEGINTLAGMPEAEVVISAIVGGAGLLPTLSAVKAGKTVGIANKETLVMAGDIVISEAKRSGAVLIPVDSEHSAVFQCLGSYEKRSVRKLVLTASGGPFEGKKKNELEAVTLEDALKHPNWSMGRKITIDSATLMNKGLEVIEAHHLFAFPPDKVDVLIHPQSIIHSMVEFADGTFIAQLSRPDMKAPIAYAMSYPERLDNVITQIGWETLQPLTFRKPDTDTFPCLGLAYDALGEGGTMPAVLNAANEVAVQAFLDRGIGFMEIPAIIKKVMDAHKVKPASDLDGIMEADAWARKNAAKEIES
ncbi:MAG: 1-deoxy-D-xylulose-5-phosphate reductoisomerase [Nitrospirae bacterium]|nr:MAG: 1-deoxy-D-xylulose-5-phosphate reductoisomerase [Nitrospirota bacterium]